MSVSVSVSLSLSLSLYLSLSCLLLFCFCFVFVLFLFCMFLFLLYSCFYCVVNITGYHGHCLTPRFGFRCGMHDTLIATNKNTKAIVYTKMLLCATTLCGDFLRPRYVFLACQHPPCRKGVKSQKTACGCPCGGVEKLKKQNKKQLRDGLAKR